MKRITLILVGFIMFTALSCRDEKAKSETIIIEKQVETPKAKASEGTSLSIDKNGVEFSTKDGAKKTDITIE